MKKLSELSLHELMLLRTELLKYPLDGSLTRNHITIEKQLERVELAITFYMINIDYYS